MRQLLLVLFAALAFVASPATAKTGKSDSWLVSQRSGDARVVRYGLQPASLTVNAALSPGDTVVTGATGRATLVRGADYIVVAPRSRLRLPAVERAGGITTVIQDLGTMLFKIKPTGVPHFAVDTPMLAAVVKGTTFTVVVDRDRSAVQVTEGLVEVSADQGGMTSLVAGGRTVFINHDNPAQIIEADAATLGNRTASSETFTISGSKNESLVLIASLTDGLVRAEATPVAAPRTSAVVADAINGPVQADSGGALPGLADPGVEVADGAVTVPGASDGGLTVPGLTTPELSTPGLTVPGLTVPELTVPELTVPELTVPELTVPELTVPELTVPELTVPELTVPELTVPEVTIPEVTVPDLTVPELTVPEVTTPELTVPELTVPEVTTPELTVPELTTPEITVPEVTTPELTVPELTVPELTVPEVTVPEITVPEVTVPEVTVPEVSLPELSLSPL